MSPKDIDKVVLSDSDEEDAENEEEPYYLTIVGSEVNRNERSKSSNSPQLKETTMSNSETDSPLSRGSSNEISLALEHVMDRYKGVPNATRSSLSENESLNSLGEFNKSSSSALNGLKEDPNSLTGSETDELLSSQTELENPLSTVNEPTATTLEGQSRNLLTKMDDSATPIPVTSESLSALTETTNRLPQINNDSSSNESLLPITTSISHSPSERGMKLQPAPLTINKKNELLTPPQNLRPSSPNRRKIALPPLPVMLPPSASPLNYSKHKLTTLPPTGSTPRHSGISSASETRSPIYTTITSLAQSASTAAIHANGLESNYGMFPSHSNNDHYEVPDLTMIKRPPNVSKLRQSTLIRRWKSQEDITTINDSSSYSEKTHKKKKAKKPRIKKNKDRNPESEVIAVVTNLKQQMKRMESKLHYIDAMFHESLGKKLEETEEMMSAERKRANYAERRAKMLERELKRAKLEAKCSEKTSLKPVSVPDQRNTWIIQNKEIEFTDQSELGQGAWSYVKIAKFRGVTCVAKCIDSTIISDYNHHLFMREITLEAQLSHPNIVQVIGISTDITKDPVILKELMQFSLKQMLPSTPLSPSHIRSIGTDIARALNYLHLMLPTPIVHQNVTSTNVLLNLGPGYTYVAKLADCGSAKFVQRAISMGVGSQVYAAPELIDLCKQTPKMDVYSYGVLLLEMCLRDFPDPEFIDREALLVKVKTTEVVELITSCLDEDQQRRPTMSQILATLVML